MSSLSKQMVGGTSVIGQENELQTFLKEMFARSSRGDNDGQVRLQEIGRLMNMDQGYCMEVIARLRRQGYVEVNGGVVSITGQGYDRIMRSYEKDIDFAELASTIEALESRVSDLELKVDEEINEIHEELRSLLEDIRNGDTNRAVTTRKLWGLSDRVLHSTANVTSIINFLRTIWPFMSSC